MKRRTRRTFPRERARRCGRTCSTSPRTDADAQGFLDADEEEGDALDEEDDEDVAEDDEEEDEDASESALTRFLHLFVDRDDDEDEEDERRGSL